MKHPYKHSPLQWPPRRRHSCPQAFGPGGAKKTHHEHRSKLCFREADVTALPRGRFRRHRPGGPHGQQGHLTTRAEAEPSRAAPPWGEAPAAGLLAAGRTRLASQAAAGHYLAGRCAGIPAVAVAFVSSAICDGDPQWHLQSAVFLFHSKSLAGETVEFNTAVKWIYMGIG